MKIQSTNQTNSTYKNNKQSFGAAKITVDKKNLLWPGTEYLKFEEKYVNPLIKFFKKLTSVKVLENAIKQAPDNVEVKLQVTNYNPEKFKVEVGNKNKPEYEWVHKMISVDSSKEEMKAFAEILAESIKAV